MELGSDGIVCGDSLERAGLRAVPLGIGHTRFAGGTGAARLHRRGRIERGPAGPGSSDRGEPPTPGPEPRDSAPYGERGTRGEAVRAGPRERVGSDTARPAGQPAPQPTYSGTAPGHAGDPQPPDPGPVGQSGPDSAAFERLARSNAELARGALGGQPKKKGS